MTRRITICPLLLISAGFLFGCNAMPTQVSGGGSLTLATRNFVIQREQRARALEADGALRPALQEWELIQTVSAGARDAGVEIARLRQAIDAGFARHRRAAKVAKSKSDLKGAQLALLKALALKPDDVKTIAELKSLEGQRIYTSMADSPRVSDVVESEVDVYTAPQSEARVGNMRGPVAGGRAGPAQHRRAAKSARPGRTDYAAAENGRGDNTSRGIAHMSRNEYAAALALFLQEKRSLNAPNAQLDALIAESRQALAESHYTNGVRAFRSAQYDRAVSEFEQALKYVPDHHKARFYHSSAKQLLGN